MPLAIQHDELLIALASLPRSRRRALRTLPGVFRGQRQGRTTVSLVSPDSIRILASSDPDLTEGSKLSAGGIIAAAAREGHSLQHENALGQPQALLQDSRFPAGLALPIHERDAVAAVLYLEREEPFTAEERHTLELFINGISDRLTANSRSREATIMAALSAQLSRTGNVAQAATTALSVIAPATGANAGLILADRRGTMTPIGSYNARNFSAAYAALEAGMPYPQGLAWHTCLTGEVNFTRDYRHDPASIERLHEHLGQVIITAPVGQHGTRHTVLGLQYEPDTHVSEADLILLRNICRHLAVILGAVHAYALQDHLLVLNTRSGEDDTNGIYRQILDAAITHVPGAEAGSLLVRSDPDGPFTYEAAIGFDLDALRAASFDEQQMLAWYGRSPREWRTGQARILLSGDVDLDEFSRSTGGHDQPADLGNLAQLKSTLCLPVIYRGSVLAAVNMDNFTREDGFNDDSLRVLKQFAPPVANLLAAAFHHDEMVRASITDPLTGLTNRRGYRHDLEQIHARASRMGEPFTLLVMDLTGFKAINDALGHDAGDEALVQVAAALRGVSRAGDVLARWGGDEFTALLPGAAAREAEHAVKRFGQAVSGISFRGHRLGIDIGAASYPADAVTIPELQYCADQRMYARKEAGRRSI